MVQLNPHIPPRLPLHRVDTIEPPLIGRGRQDVGIPLALGRQLAGKISHLLKRAHQLLELHRAVLAELGDFFDVLLAQIRQRQVLLHAVADHAGRQMELHVLGPIDKLEDGGFGLVFLWGFYAGDAGVSAGAVGVSLAVFAEQFGKVEMWSLRKPVNTSPRNAPQGWLGGEDGEMLT
jgi:hypothetical protein